MSFTDKKGTFTEENTPATLKDAIKDASKKVIELNGKDRQFIKAVEEASELNDSIFKFMKGKATRQDVLEEIADNAILAEQMKQMLNCSDEEFDSIMLKKTNKLRAFLGLALLGLTFAGIGYFLV